MGGARLDQHRTEGDEAGEADPRPQLSAPRAGSGRRRDPRQAAGAPAARGDAAEGLGPTNATIAPYRHGRTWSDHPRVLTGRAEWRQANSWMVVPSTTMTN